MKKISFKASIVFVFIFLNLCFLLPIKAEVLTIIHTGDIHGNIAPEKIASDSSQAPHIQGGYALLKSFIDNTRIESIKNGGLTICLDSGDYFLGTSVVDETSGECMIDLMDQCKYFSAGIGNHEFDYSSDRLKELLRKSRFITLCCNVFDKETGKIFEPLRQYIILPFKGIKIGITAVETPETIISTFENNVKDIEVKDPVSCMKKTIKLMREKGCDFVILLSHLGIKEDPILCVDQPAPDLILGGHSHSTTKTIEYFGKMQIPVIHSGSNLLTASKVTIDLTKGKKPVIAQELVSLTDEELKEDPLVKESVKQYLKNVKDKMGKIIGYSNVTLTRGIIGGDSCAGSYIADSMREAVNADFAFINAGAIRVPLKAGQITLEDVFIVLPFNNPIITIEMTGYEIRDIIEKSISVKFRLPSENDIFLCKNMGLEPKGLLREYHDTYGALIPSNLIFEFDPDLPSGKRIIKLTDEKGRSIDDQKSYKVAHSSFITEGGEGYSILKNKKPAVNSGIILREALAKKIEREKIIKDFPQQRIFNKKLSVRRIN
ncbi:MAG: bifunctional metallophosphatase/5'-nucleotidase [Candidatus Riflebacteria bacterium]|nr:bifunctional metallophosphatase/5'-nucleotidase [Candidatus Riflebacteria bacterium]